MMLLLLLRILVKILVSKRAIAPLVLILIVSSAAFTVTIAVFLSVEGLGSSFLGEEANTVIISSYSSRTPVSSDIPLELASKISQIGTAYSPEVLAPSTLVSDGNRSVIVRGVDPELFGGFDHIVMQSGKLIQENETEVQVMVGGTLARALDIRPGSTLLISGVLAPVTVSAFVSGVFETGTTIDNEIVAPLWVGQWLRGFSYGTISIIRVRASPSASAFDFSHKVEQMISSSGAATTSSSSSPQNNNDAAPPPPIFSYLPFSFSSPSASSSSSPLSSSGGQSSQLEGRSFIISTSTSSDFISHAFGLSEESVWILAALTFAGVSLGLYFSLQEVIHSSRRELGTLRAIGVSLGRLRRGLSLSAIIVSVVPSILGWLVGVLLLEFIPSLNPITIAFYSVSTSGTWGIALAGTVVIAVAEILISGVVSAQQFTLDYAVKFGER
jgi:ABC-type lipoprotein release transport system permease subunit